MSDEEKPDRILCTNCLHENDEYASFCVECGAPIGAYASTLPLDRIYAEGHMLRQSVSGRGGSKPIVLIGIWLMFFPGLVFLFLEVESIALNGWASISIDTVGMAACAFVSAVILYKTTRNFIRSRRAAGLDAEDAEELAAEKSDRV